MLNTIKNVAIIVDFVISMIAFAVQNTSPKFSGNLYMVSALVLAVAFVCALIDLLKKKKK